MLFTSGHNIEPLFVFGTSPSVVFSKGYEGYVRTIEATSYIRIAKLLLVKITDTKWFVYYLNSDAWLSE